jgi:hypothetical protein
MQLAVKLYKDPQQKGIMDCSTRRNEETWIAAFGPDKDITRLLLSECCPLKCSDSRYSFIHKSLLEYFVARANFATMTSKDCIDDGLKEDAKSLMKQLDLVSDPATEFLAEYARESN